MQFFVNRQNRFLLIQIHIMFEDLELSNAPFFQLAQLRDQLEEYVLLDLGDAVDDVHLLHLFDLCERLQLTSCVQQLYYKLV